MGSPGPVFPRARLAVAAVLFVGWMGILLVLVLRTRDPVILSRPQLLVSNLVVIAQVHEGKGGAANPVITVKEVLWSAKKDDKSLKAMPIDVAGIAEGVQGWRGTGEYIVPLLKNTAGKELTYQVTQMPVVPGFNREKDRMEGVRIYPATAEALAQWHDLAIEWDRLAP